MCCWAFGCICTSLRGSSGERAGLIREVKEKNQCNGGQWRQENHKWSICAFVCLCVCVWNRTMHVAFLRCQPRPLIGHRLGGHFIHCCVAERKKQHSHTPENLPIFEKSRTYSRLLSHSRGQRTCKLRRAREAVTSDWPSDEKRPLASITFALVFNKSNQKGKKKKKSLLLHSCRTPVAHVLTSHQRRERGAGRNTIKDGGVFL